MDFKAPNNKDQLKLLFYKLFNDILFLWIIFFLGAIIAESLLPGFVSNYLSFTKMILAIFLILGGIGYLGRASGLSFGFSERLEIRKNKALLALLVLSLLLIANSLRGFGWLTGLITLGAAVLAIFYLYKVFILEE